MVFLWYGSAEPDLFSINQSFLILFMVIIGGLGSLIGSYFGAALIYLLPIALRTILPALGLRIAPSSIEHMTTILVGALIILFLIVEPHGLARLWQTSKQKLRAWPFPY
jgi:branched-chain amino acid transport system permease protein